MTRGLSAAQLTAAAGSHRIAVPLMEMFFDSGTLRLAITPWNIVVGANTFTAVGPLMALKQLHEASDSIEGMECKLNGVDAAAIALATQEPYRGRIVRLYKAYLNADTHAVIGTPTVMFLGRMKSMVIDEDNTKCDITMISEHYEAELRRAAPLRLNDSDQQRLYPGDLGCQHAEAMTELQLIWPSKEVFEQ